MDNKTNMYLVMILIFSYLIGGVLFYQQHQDLKEWQNQAETAEMYIQELQGE